MDYPISIISFQNVGLYLSQDQVTRKLNSCKGSIVQIFIDNGYDSKFITDILDSIDNEQIYYITKNLSELKNKIKMSKEQIIKYLTCKQKPDSKKELNKISKTAFKKWKV